MPWGVGYARAAQRFFMPAVHHPAVHDRLAELVVCLSGTDDKSARRALEDAASRHGEWGDTLLNVADALVAIRGDASGVRIPVGSSS